MVHGFSALLADGQLHVVAHRSGAELASSVAGEVLFVHGLETAPRAGPRRLSLHNATSRALQLGARRTGDADPEEQMRVTIVLRRRRRRPILPGRGRGLGRRRFLSRAEFVSLLGAIPRHLDRVEAFAVRQGLLVIARDPARRTVVVSGRARDMARAFGIRLAHYSLQGRTYRGLDAGQNVNLPEPIAPLVLAVLGLENFPVVRPLVVAPKVAPRATFAPNQLAALYRFPTGGATGQTIGILEFGGGFVQQDITTYFANLGLPVPNVLAVSVDGTPNSPTGNPNSADGEVMLDIEVAGAVAPGANLAVYFAANTDQGFFDAVTAPLNDAQNNPSVVSISWGAAEPNWADATRDAVNQAFADAGTLGITVFAASGDDGSSDGIPDGQDHVDFPASSPFVSACGGTTMLEPSGETAWTGSGGGVSAVFAKPPWQSGVTVPPPSGAQGGRGVPDIAGDADPQRAMSCSSMARALSSVGRARSPRCGQG
jgi:kumamolisin